MRCRQPGRMVAAAAVLMLAAVVAACDDDPARTASGGGPGDASGAGSGGEDGGDTGSAAPDAAGGSDTLLVDTVLGDTGLPEDVDADDPGPDVAGGDSADSGGAPGDGIGTNDGTGAGGWEPAAPWLGLARAVARSPYGHDVVVNCHNCYVTGEPTEAQNAEGTLDRLHAAEALGADALELDVVVTDGVWRVGHDDDGVTSWARLDAVVSDPALVAGDRLLFVEIKETTPDPERIAALIDLLAANGHGGPQRPIILRTFRDLRQHLLDARDLLAAPPRAGLSVRLHELYSAVSAPDEPTMQAYLDQAVADGLHGVELDYRSINVVGRLNYARQHGLTTGIWTVPKDDGDLIVASWRGLVDAITTEYRVDRARAVVSEPNGLLLLDVSDQSGYGDGVRYHRRSAVSRLAAVGGPGLAKVVMAPPGEDLVGFYLDLDDADPRSVDLGPVEGRPGEGFLVNVVVNFDDLAAADERMILASSDAAGFYLRVVEDRLEFAVRVDGAYRTASTKRSQLSDTDSYLVTGAYDGHETVRLLVNGSAAGVTPGEATGPVVQSGSPVRVGADPQGATDTRFPFDGKIQRVEVLSWGRHDCVADADCAALDTTCEVGRCSPAGLCAAQPAPGASACLEFEDLMVVVRTADLLNAGTDDGTRICLSPSWCRPLDNAAVNDNERGQVDQHRFRGRPGAIPMTSVTLENVPPGGADAWMPACVALVADGKLIYCADTLQPLQIGTDAGDAPGFTDPDPTTVACAACYPTVLTHGPLVGHTTATTSRIWVRAASALPVTVRWSTALSLADPVETPPVLPAMEDDFAAVVPLEGLPPDTLVYYEVRVAGAVASASPLSFRTAPEGASAFTVAFGSCMKFDVSATMPVFGSLLADGPDLLVLLGDNHYANTTDVDRLGFYYRRSRGIPSFAQVVANMPVWATWDDHDYTGNNTEAHVAGKTFSLDAFRRFWANPSAGTETTAGVFTRFAWGDVDFFLLDDRWYRDAAAGTLLGPGQLAWLVEELTASTATFKVVASGSQWTLGGSSDSWAVFPTEREQLFDLLMAQGISGVLLLSGDVHRAEVRRLRDRTAASYELWELTASPFAQVGSPCSAKAPPDTVLFCASDSNFYNLLRFDTDRAVPRVVHEVHDVSGALRHSVTIGLDQLTL